MNEIVMPKLSDTMTEGRLVSWKKRVGETVRRGDVLAEVETDKANMELEAFVSGELLEIKVQSGEMAQVGTVIAVIGTAEEKGSQGVQPEAAGVPETTERQAEQAASEPKAGTAEPAAVAPEPASAVDESGRMPEAWEKVARGGAQQAPPAETEDEKRQAMAEMKQGEPQAPAAASAAVGSELEGAEGQGGAESRERAAPVVRRRARELGVVLTTVRGSGPNGRILLQDLEHAKTVPEDSAPPVERVAKPASDQGPRPLSRLRAAIAKTVSESWRTIPHFDVTMDLVMDEAEAVRHQLKQSGLAVSLTDLLIKGVALALQKFPQLNATFTPEGAQRHGEINIGVAVAVSDGVLVPVISGCQGLSLQAISQAGRRLADRARSGSLSEQEMSGGTFSVSNLGMYGASQFSAIIYPSQAAVLAVGAVVDTVVVRAGTPACAKVMKVTLSADHRLVDGAYAAQFLAEFRDILESPVRLLL